jgi:C-terminal processing protease CtpA/Prc
MVTRQCDNEEPTIRVYKYGLVPIGHLDERAIEELWRANKMWNKLVELHYQNRADWEKARCAANLQYLKITTDLAALNEKISKAYDDKRTARMNAGTGDTSLAPQIKEGYRISATL